MRALKSGSPVTPEDLQAVARGCPMAVLAEMVLEFEQSPSGDPLADHQANGTLVGHWSAQHRTGRTRSVGCYGACHAAPR